ncbi:thiamine phosphate synthase [Altericista sp. CCNU0014]|uniref:thiamine phosphate synthase n=1 Tax=Altericista sp. CCNU0014 TaxID=3082949 RepID=UPI00384A6B64
MPGLPFDILVVTDRVVCERAGKTVIAAIAQLLHSPCSHRVAILVRDKEAPQARVGETIQTLQPMAQAAGAMLLAHTHVELALAFGLDGVHVASTAALGPVRSQLLPGMLLGASRHGQDPLNEADLGLADYATISPIYRPTSKPDDTREPLGLSGLKTCTQRSARPLVALGGIRPGRVAPAVKCGAAAIAISGAILQADDPADLLQQLWIELSEARQELFDPVE